MRGQTLKESAENIKLSHLTTKLEFYEVVMGKILLKEKPKSRQYRGKLTHNEYQEINNTWTMRCECEVRGKAFQEPTRQHIVSLGAV